MLTHSASKGVHPLDCSLNALLGAGVIDGENE
jgi:hypothetical protein